MQTTQPNSPNFQSLETNVRKSSCGWKRAAACAVTLAACFALPPRADALILATEDFSGGSALWIDRDTDEMTVTHAAGFGDPLGSLRGSFAAQGTPLFENDAFRAGPASSSGQFSGNFYLSYVNFSSVQFAFYAEDVLPSTFIFRIGDGTNTFMNNITPQLSTPAMWTTVNVSLAYSGGWLGGSASSFSNVFTSVAFMDVQVGRGGTNQQDYFLDNFTLLDSALATVPEPGSIGLVLIGGIVLRLVHKRRRAKGIARIP